MENGEAREAPIRDGRTVRNRVDRGDSIGYTVVETVAAATGMTMEELPPLYQSIDTDALDEMVAPRRRGSARSTVTVEFEYQGNEVIVDGNTVEVRLPEG